MGGCCREGNRIIALRRWIYPFAVERGRIGDGADLREAMPLIAAKRKLHIGAVGSFILRLQPALRFAGKTVSEYGGEI